MMSCIDNQVYAATMDRVLIVTIDSVESESRKDFGRIRKATARTKARRAVDDKCVRCRTQLAKDNLSSYCSLCQRHLVAPRLPVLADIEEAIRRG